MNKDNRHNIILIGYMGSGKTSVGEDLAEQLNYHFHDTDHMIEQKAGDTINHIFTNHGEDRFRDMETELLKELQPSLHQTVLSTGGGMPLREQNAILLKEMGYVVFLKASKDTTLQRLAGDQTRPLLRVEDMEQRVEQMLQARTPIYEKAAHLVVVTDGRSIGEIAQSIIEVYQNIIQE